MIELIKNGSPLYIKPYLEKKVWGASGIGEYWYGAESGEKSSMGVIEESSMPMDRLLNGSSNELLGRQVVERFGKFLPLVKILTPKARLSVQFHDKKNELWVVTDIDREAAGPNPCLIAGFSPSMIDKFGDNIKEEYKKALNDYGKLLNELIVYLEESGFKKELMETGNVIEAAMVLKEKDAVIGDKLGSLLKAEKALDSFYNHVSVDIGDVIPVPQGTLHALGRGINIVEPQIPGPTQSLEDGATYPVRYYFPDHPCKSGKKKLDLDRIGEISTKKWDKGRIDVIEGHGKLSVERLPGGFEEKGMQVNRIMIPAAGRYTSGNLKSYHTLVVIKGKADLVVMEKRYSIPKAGPGSLMLLVPASSGVFSISAGADSQVLDTFTPV